jgi:hypothetical protein
LELTGPIKPKKSSTGGEIPTALDLEVGEIAVNTADGKLFVKHADNTIKEISGGSGDGGGGGGGATSLGDLTDVYIPAVPLTIWEDEGFYFYDGEFAAKRLGDNNYEIAFGKKPSNLDTGTWTDSWAAGDILELITASGQSSGETYEVAYKSNEFNGYAVKLLNSASSQYLADLVDEVTSVLGLSNLTRPYGGLTQDDLLGYNPAELRWQVTNAYLSTTELKAIVAASSDFADFQSRISAL